MNRTKISFLFLIVVFLSGATFAQETGKAKTSKSDP